MKDQVNTKISFLKKIIFSLIAIILFFGFLEGGLQLLLFFRPVGQDILKLDPYEEPDPNFGWRLKTNYQTIKFSPNTGGGELLVINSKGFRGKEFNKEKPAGTTRIIVMGDSVTFGITPESCPYPFQLQQLLDRKYPKKFEVINAGVEGYSSEYVLKRLKYDILQYHPDIVIIYVGWNDLYGTNPSNPLNNGKHVRLAKFLNNFYIYKGARRIIFFQIKPIIEQVLISQEAREKDIDLYQNFIPNKYKENLRQIIETGKQNNIQMVLLNLSSILSDNMTDKALKKVHYPYFTTGITELRILQQSYNNVIKKISQEEGVPLIDINKAIDQISDKEKLFFDTMHLYCSGNAVIARTIFNFFVNQNITNTK